MPLSPAARLGLAAALLLAFLPYLWPSHVPPIPSFGEEWLAAACGLAACMALVDADGLPVPGAVLTAVLLAGLAGYQALVGLAPVPPLTSLFSLYLCWAALLASAGSRLARVVGQAGLIRTLAIAVLSGAVLSALAADFQPWLEKFGWPGFPPALGGPLGQGNHFTGYLWLGLASAIYLRAAAVLSPCLFWTAAVLLTATAVLVGQRSSLLYAAALVVVAVLAARRGDAPPGSRRPAVAIALLFVVLQPVGWLPFPAALGVAAPQALRAFQQAKGPSVRIQLWRVGAGAIADAPLLGHGIGSYPTLALAYADAIPAGENPGPSEHAHNILVDLAAELGLPAALLVLGGGCLWLWRLPGRAAPAEASWAASVLIILGLHSMIEYPLWNSYFLGLAALVAGAFGSRRAVGGRLLPLAVCATALVSGGLVLAGLQRDAANLESAHALGKDPATLAEASAALLKVPASSLLSPWVVATACASLDPLRVPLADGLAVCRPGTAFAPTVESEVNLAVLLWRAGETEQARDRLRRLRTATAQYGSGRVAGMLAPLAAREAGLQELGR